MPAPTLRLSAFADEASASKRLDEQLAAVSAIGLRQYTIRFVDLTGVAGAGGVKNVVTLDAAELAAVARRNAELGLEVASIGSPIGKVKLLDREDGSGNRYVPFGEYLTGDVERACRAAVGLGTKFVRGFSFYHPKGESPDAHLPQAIDQLGGIAEACAAHGLLFGLEVEANLVGQSGQLLREVHRQVNHPALVLVFDAANLLTQGYSPDETFDEYLAMKDGLGWIHVKDYRPMSAEGRVAHVDEEALCEYRTVEGGSGVYQRVFDDLIQDAHTIAPRMQALGLPGLLVDLEPHVRGGGQFGGYSGPDGLGIALRSLCRVLDAKGLGYDLRDHHDLRPAVT
ncbi:MAG: sugar phosphate isomerase/epimerase family protein [Lacipirellulaceae bacterium]